MQIFNSHFVFRRQTAEFFFSKEIRRIKAGKNDKYGVTKPLKFEVCLFVCNYKLSKDICRNNLIVLNKNNLARIYNQKTSQNNSSFIIHLLFWHTVNEPIFWVEMPYCVRPFTCTVHISTANQGYINQVCPNPILCRYHHLHKVYKLRHI